MGDHEQRVRAGMRERSSGGIDLGRVFGVKLTIDWSFVFIFLLVTWALVAFFTRAHGSWAFASRVALAVTAALLFALSIVGHELSHALVARRFGVPVHELRLFLLGGVSDLEREPPSPRAELLIALAGPAVSFAIGALCLTFAALLGAPLPAADRGPLSAVLLWLGPINLLIGTFNLIPGFPLDGGRVLRAVLWRVTGDLQKATRHASTLGQATGWSFVVLGVAILFGVRVPLFGASPANGLWLALIGVFLATAARRSYQAVVLEKMLEGVTVRDLMRTEGDVIAPGAPLSSAVSSFLRSRERMFPVMGDDGFVGTLSLEDMARAPRDAWATTRVAEVMTPLSQLEIATPEEAISSALRKLGRLENEELPVVEGGRLVGMLEGQTLERWIDMQTLSVRSRRAVRLA